MKKEKPKRGVWFLLAFTSLLALSAVLTGDDFVRLLANAIFVVSAVWATFHFLGIHRIGFTLIVLAIFGVVMFVAGRPTPVAPSPDLLTLTTTATATSVSKPPMPVQAEPPLTPRPPRPTEPKAQTGGTKLADAQDAYLQSLQVQPQQAETKSQTTGTTLTDAQDAYLQSLQVQPIPYSETTETKTTTTPIVIQRGSQQPLAREWFYLDESTATYHAEGCPEIRPTMSRGVKSAAALRGFQPHTCVK